MNMPKPLERRAALFLATGALLVGLAIAILYAGDYFSPADKLIEVGGTKTTYVPRTTKFVTVNGEVRKITKFSTALTSNLRDCKCPNCCDGHCYVIVFTDGAPSAGPIIILAMMWLAC
jgi:hypothetical protein